MFRLLRSICKTCPTEESLRLFTGYLQFLTEIPKTWVLKYIGRCRSFYSFSFFFGVSYFKVSICVVLCFAEKMDHVSSLPEGVLCHILSFLTTKEAALTSILCKRWRNLLAFVPNLVIDDSVFLHPEEGKEERYEIQQSFMEFVDRVLALQGNSPIKKFSLKFRTDFASHRVDAWISNVLARGVSELDVLVILYGAEFLPLSPKCFKSRNLVTLKINSLGIDWLAGDISLPMLKTLVLHSVKLCVDKFFFVFCLRSRN